MSRESSQLEEFPDKPDVSSNDEAESRSSVVQVSASWSGPIPPPGDIERYEAVLPGATDRILTMAEKAQSHRHDRAMMSLETEKMVASEDSKRSYLGVVSALLISLICIGGGLYLIFAGQAWAGIALVGFDLAGLVAVFIYGTNSRRTESRSSFEDEDHEEE